MAIQAALRACGVTEHPGSHRLCGCLATAAAAAACLLHALLPCHCSSLTAQFLLSCLPACSPVHLQEQERRLKEHLGGKKPAGMGNGLGKKSAGRHRSACLPAWLPACPPARFPGLPNCTDLPAYACLADSLCPPG